MSDIAGLRVVFDADVDALIKGANNGGKAVENLGIKVKATEKSFTKLGGTTKYSSYAVTNLGNLAQDAAFGFLGIANNIEPFITSLGSLKAQAGSAKLAFSSFFSSLAGPAGFGILIGALSLLDAYSKGYGIFSNKVKEAEKTQKDAAKTAAESAQTEIAALKLLVSVAQDVTFSTKQRQGAVDELQRKYPAYLGNLSKEQILTGNIAGEVDKLSKALLNKALSQATGSTIGKLAQELDEANVVLTKATNSAIKQTEKFKKSITNENGKISDSNYGLIADELARINKPANEAQRAVDALTKKIDAAFERQKSYAKLAGDILFEPTTGGLASDTENIKKNTVAVYDAVAAYEAWIRAAAQLKNQGILNARDISKVSTATPLAGIGTVTKGVKVPVILDIPNADEVGKQFIELSQIIQSSAIDAFSNIGEALGSGLGLKGAFSAILKTLASGFKEVGKAMIASAPLIKALKAIFSNPAAAVPAGVALIALGSFLESKVPKLATGGIVTSPQQAIIGESGPEAVIPLGRVPSLFGGSGGGTFEFVIQGSTLRTVLQRADKRAARIG